MKVNELYINERIKKALIELNYNELTQVQQEVIPLIFEEYDLLVESNTGSGKTASFMIPIINNILKEDNRFRISTLVIAPTRELAFQIHENTMKYSKYTNIRSLALIGGVKESYQKQKINQGVDVLIATPGRLLDFINQKIINLKNIKYVVIDEADKLLDMGFINDINKILSYIKVRQTLLFSATISDDIKKISNSILNNYKEVFIKKEELNIIQNIYFIDQLDKLYLLKDIIKKERMESVIIFCRTKFSSEKTSNFLRGNNILSDYLNKDKSQVDRIKTLNDFKNKKIQALVATDIASRGIDVEIMNVINFDMPDNIQTYIHRIGRTGRNRKKGVATSFCDESEFQIYEKIKESNIINILDHNYKKRD